MVTIVYSHHDGESAIPSDFVDELRAVIGEYTKNWGFIRLTILNNIFCPLFIGKVGQTNTVLTEHLK